jgi:hypothetical protein
MGGIIEDKIYEVLMKKKLTVKQIVDGLENKVHYERAYNTIDHHLRKMISTKELEREKNDNGKYVYWNPCMLKNK